MHLLTYTKEGGLIRLRYELINETPIWNFRYKEDRIHENNNALNKDKELIIGLPSSIIRPIHSWSFLFTNPANFKIEDVKVKLHWLQEINGELKPIQNWEGKLAKINAVDGGQIKHEILMNPA